ncbi:response regulator transcription factor [Desulfobulbus alkaliphilus]|uniref:response regulator transcription factor n=1 Tax=Desulfobulbus alkaliphilus TaxID=869814 RepID=UPI001966A96B|nr:response regulator transcription factor [Desulfobulbus alkaliphilus]MBM9538127.1 response regulator transcription factor [Desulfobulbus alkaliphilus]
MNLILCSTVSDLRKRWHQALTPAFTVHQAASLRDLTLLVQDRVSFDLLLLHRPLVDAEIIAYIRDRLPDCRLFVLSDRPDDQEGLGFLRLGVVGYANSYTSPQRLSQAAGAVAAGAVWINRQLMQRLIAGTAPAPKENTDPDQEQRQRLLAQLSKRELQIATLVADGLANLEIAEQLGITERTVKAHLSAVYFKTAIRSRLGLALLMKQK